MNETGERSALDAYEAHKVVRDLRQMIRINRLLSEAQAMDGLWLGSKHLLPGDELCVAMDGTIQEDIQIGPTKTILAKVYSSAKGELDICYDTDDEESWQNHHINLTSVDYDAALEGRDSFVQEESIIKVGGTVVVDTVGLGFRPSTTQILPARFCGLSVNKAVFF